MLDIILKVTFVIGLVASETIRFPHRMRVKRERKEKRLADERWTVSDFVLDLLAFAGMEIIPLVYVLTPWLGFADYRLPVEVQALMGVAGALAFAAGLWLLWRSHADLGRNWSPTLQIMEQHALVTRGVYGRIRHPIYAAVWLVCLGQALLLQNWIAGLAGLVLFLPVYVLRVPKEERMMLDHFGDEYREYMGRTGRITPRLGR
ncbi:MAG: isoprenylcysteine carboxylmethyltransferase family protein [Chloroflexi bacterium]|nr:isoprenylcysteine carboxylmethyltransferase family protein [Chloroflexota bacterium]MBU1750697.1 isoprenylcysteine carboxylmethyltransferase family protein [Chloroflexota bacterium]MBU1878219.1 isoprenylcysteine carboxylmethyltransferase family protein [Chloroflexota bacterium]